MIASELTGAHSNGINGSIIPPACANTPKGAETSNTENEESEANPHCNVGVLCKIPKPALCQRICATFAHLIWGISNTRYNSPRPHMNCPNKSNQYQPLGPGRPLSSLP
jgi:hypothetical protein